MGNTLCKERIERAENSKSPVDRVIGRCAQVNHYFIVHLVNFKLPRTQIQ